MTATLYVGAGHPDYLLPEQYLNACLLVQVPADDYRTELTCSRCSQWWQEHAWLVYAGSSSARPTGDTVDCSARPRRIGGPTARGAQNDD